MPIVEAKFAALKEIKPHEYAVRFLLGGLCTVAAWLIARRFGPGIGGLFLAFPAIFPAGATLIAKHEKEEKRKAGFDGANRGRMAASVDAAGASIGCIGLAGFAVVVWKLLTQHNSYVVVFLATGAWVAVSIAFWLLRKSRFLHRQRRVLPVGSIR